MIDQASLFLHVLAAAGMVAGGVTQVLAGSRLRAATTTAAVREWATFARTAGLVILGSAVVSFMTGGHLAGAVWTTEESSGFSQPFITLGAVALVLLAPIGPMIGGARLRRLAADAAEDGEARDELVDATRSPVLWGAVHSLVGLCVGFIAVMTIKPGWVATAVVLVGTFDIGWLAGHVVAKRSTAVATSPLATDKPATAEA